MDSIEKEVFHIYVHVFSYIERIIYSYIHICVCSVTRSDCFQPLRLLPARLLCPWNSPGKNTGVGCRFLLQGIFQTQGSNLCLWCLLHSGRLFTAKPLGKPICIYTGKIIHNL